MDISTVKLRWMVIGFVGMGVAVIVFGAWENTREDRFLSEGRQSAATLLSDSAERCRDSELGPICSWRADIAFLVHESGLLMTAGDVNVEEEAAVGNSVQVWYMIDEPTDFVVGRPGESPLGTVAIILGFAIFAGGLIGFAIESYSKRRSKRRLERPLRDI